MLGSRPLSRLRAVAVGLGAGVTTFIALGWVIGLAVTLVMVLLCVVPVVVIAVKAQRTPDPDHSR